MEYPDEISRKIGEIPVDGDIPWYPDEYPVGEIPVVDGYHFPQLCPSPPSLSSCSNRSSCSRGGPSLEWNETGQFVMTDWHVLTWIRTTWTRYFKKTSKWIWTNIDITWYNMI
jgi:hypothetical protein